MGFQLRQLILPVAIIISLVLYYPTHTYGVVTDYLGWLNKYRVGGWSGILHCFHYKGLHQFFHLVNFSIYKVTQGNLFGLYLIFAGMHGLTGYAVYRALRRVGEWFDFEHAGTVSFFGAILFLLSPYSVETVTWKACFHYLMITAMTCVNTLLLIRYFETTERRFLFLHMVLFALSLLTLELGLVVPGIFGTLYLSKAYKSNDSKLFWMGLRISALHALMLVMYFIGTKVMIGNYIGHYGAEKHLVTTGSVLFGGLAKYTVKLLTLSHYLPFNPRYQLYEHLNQWRYMLPVLALGALIFVWALRKGRSSAPHLFLSWCMASYVVALLPVINLFFINIHSYENDRYSYFASMFFYAGLITLIFILIPRFKYGITLLYAGLLLLVSVSQVAKVGDAGKIINSLVADFRWYDADEVVIIAMPQNYDGIYALGDYSDEALALYESLDWLRDKPYKGTFRCLSLYNLKNDDRHIKSTFLDPNLLEVWNVAGGSWFWRQGVGMGSYEDKGLKVDMRDMHYRATFDTISPTTVFIEPVGGKWEEIKRIKN